MAQNNRTMMTTTELAEYLNIPVSRVYDRWREWGIPAVRIGTTLRFRISDVDEWLDARTEIGSTPQCA